MVDETQSGRGASWRNRNGITFSVVIHVAAVIAFAFGLRGYVKLAVYKLPGTAKGLQSLTYYSPGSSQSVPTQTATKAALRVQARVGSAMAISRLLSKSISHIRSRVCRRCRKELLATSF
jgi:hypothetical protein